MGLTEQQYKDIQNYLDGRMRLEEQVAFEQQLQTDPLLKEFFLFEQELRANLDYIQDNEAIKPSFEIAEGDSRFDDPGFVLNLIEQEGKKGAGNFESTNSSPLLVVTNEEQTAVPIGSSHSFPFSRYVAAAACLVLFATGIVWFISNTSEPQPVAATSTKGKVDLASGTKHEQASAIPASDTSKSVAPLIVKVNTATLFKRYYKREEVPAQIPEQLADALSDYNAKDYVAIQQMDLEDIPKSRGPEAIEGPQYIKELGSYFKGLSYIETGNYQQAIINLHWVADYGTNSHLKSKAQWYLALSYLKINNTEKAASLLTSVSKNADAAPFDSKAKELLMAMKGPMRH